jgi:hypothetical protein
MSCCSLDEETSHYSPVQPAKRSAKGADGGEKARARPSLAFPSTLGKRDG